MAVGWVSIHREIFDHWTWKDKPFSQGQAWIDLIMRANHEEGSVMIKGTVYNLARGQQARSALTLASEWGWSRGKVERFLKVLKTERQIEHQTDNKTSIITICNYSKYQKKRAADDAALDTAPDTAPEQHPSTNNKGIRKQVNKKTKETNIAPIPENFQITEEMKAWAKEKEITVDLESATDKWADAMRAKKTKYADWVSAWRNGMRNAQKWHDRENPPKSSATVHPFTNHPRYKGLWEKAKECGHSVSFDNGKDFLWVSPAGHVS